MLRAHGIHIRHVAKPFVGSFSRIGFLKSSTRFDSTLGFRVVFSAPVFVKPCMKPNSQISNFATKTYKPAHWKNDPNLMEIYEVRSKSNLLWETAGYYLHRYRNVWFGVLPIALLLNAGHLLLPIFIFFFSFSNRTRIRVTQILFDRSEQKVLLFRPGFDSQMNVGHVLVAELTPNTLQYSASMQLNFFFSFSNNPFYQPHLQNKLYLHPLQQMIGEKKSTVYEIKDHPHRIQELKSKLEHFGVLPGDFFS